MAYGVAEVRLTSHQMLQGDRHRMVPLRGAVFDVWGGLLLFGARAWRSHLVSVSPGGYT